MLHQNSEHVLDPETYELLEAALRVGIKSKTMTTKQAALETVARFLGVELRQSGPTVREVEVTSFDGEQIFHKVVPSIKSGIFDQAVYKLL